MEVPNTVREVVIKIIPKKKEMQKGKVEKGMPEDEMVGWHHRLDGYESEQAMGVGDGQGNLVCCSPWGHRVGHDWAEQN